MPTKSATILGLGAVLFLAVARPAAAGAKWVLVIGDSLSEEYAFMIDAGGPYTDFGFSSPDSDQDRANTANWVEILANWRGPLSGMTDYLVFGSYAGNWPAYADLRQAGYAGNFGIPGYTSLNWQTLIFSPQNQLHEATKKEIADQIATFEGLGIEFVIVIMLGGNDLKAEYNDIFNGTESPTLYNIIRTRLMNIADGVDGPPASPRPVVLCTVPDVGVTPSVAQTYSPTLFPAKRAAARAKIQAMNDELKTQAAAKGYAVADIHAMTIRMEDEVPLKTNGQTFLFAGHPENPPRYLFCKDGFHPATVAQSVIANEVLAAINRALGSSIAPLANREVLTLIPGLDPDQPFTNWIGTQGVTKKGLHDNPDGDAFDNLAEFAFGLHAGTFDPGLGYDWSYFLGERRFGLSWSLNPATDGYLSVLAERSTDLSGWTPLDPAQITDLGGGMWRASISTSDPTAFLRARVELAP